jgi:hypothetical protein
MLGIGKDKIVNILYSKTGDEFDILCLTLLWSQMQNITEPWLKTMEEDVLSKSLHQLAWDCHDKQFMDFDNPYLFFLTLSHFLAAPEKHKRQLA